MSEVASGMPDPAEATTPAEFVDALKRLKRWSGMGFRQLEKRALAIGDALPRSTLTAALSRQSIPREELVVSLVRTCGGDAADVQRWVDARRQLMGAQQSAQQAPSGARAVLASLVPPAIRDGSWPVRAMAAICMGIVLVVVVAAVVGTLRRFIGPAGADPVEPDDGVAAGTGVPTAPAGPTATAGPSGKPGPVTVQGWTVLRSGSDIALREPQAIDFETGKIVGPNDEGADVMSYLRGGRMIAKNEAMLVVLKGAGPHTLQNCLDAPYSDWDGNIHDVYRLRSGSQICVTTGEQHAVLLTIDQVPDNVDPTIRFHYTVWIRQS